MNVRAILLFCAVCIPQSPASADETAKDYPAVVAGDSAVALWSLDETTTSNATDSVGDLHARFTAGVSVRRGVSGTAAAFRAGKGRVEATLNPEQHRRLEAVFNGSFSIELWLVDEAAAADNKVNYSILYKADPKRFISNSLWFYRTRQSGDYSFRIQSAGDPGIVLNIPNPGGKQAAGDRKWHHVVIAVDRAQSTVMGWIDGAAVASAQITDKFSINNHGPLVIGNNHYSGSPWHGAIDEVAIYDRAIPAETVQQHYLAGKRSLSSPVATPLTEVANTEEFFELNVRPLLVEKCGECHSGGRDAESSLDLGSRQTLLDGGDFGPAIVPGRSADSLLIHAVRRTHKELSMPPDRDASLSRQQIQTLARWIDAGAVWGTEAERPAQTNPRLSDTRIETDHWSFQPRQDVSPPDVKDPRWSRSEIDQFVEFRRQGIRATERADRRTLIRRATFDLIGLPATPAEIDDFLNDDADDSTAFARLVDRLLASKAYGERQGRQWLDVARYADTQGDVGDFPIPQAYLYRNWVIDSLNADLPFDQFVRAQIAGDLIARDVTDPEEARQLIIATGFIAMSRRFGNRKDDDMYLTIEDTLDTVGRGVLGLTLRCARCHDHKFDPILNTDYYRLYGIFESTQYPWMGMSDQKSPSGLASVATDPKSQQAAKDYWSLISRYEYQINNHFRPWLKPTLDEFKRVTKELTTAEAERRPQLQQKREELLSQHKGRFRELMLKGLQWIKDEKQRMADNPPVEFVFAVSEGTPHDARLHRRGNPKLPGPKVTRGFLSVLAPETPDIPSGSGRLQLAHWLTRPDHPLTARVIVNRIWQQHFGTGLVETADNFGLQGTLSTHPHLLDWLASQFVKEGWSIKQLHRRIMLSETYTMASGATDRPPQLTAFPRRRLDAEEIRDAMLAVSGQLDRTQGTAHPFRPWYSARYSLNNPFHEEFPTKRRSVYMVTQRLFRNSFLSLFDGPDRNSSTSRRESANVPSQALYLMNSPFVREQATALADRLKKTQETEPEQIVRLYELALGRVPSRGELAAISEFLDGYRAKSTAPHDPMVALCRAVLTSNEFFFID